MAVPAISESSLCVMVSSLAVERASHVPSIIVKREVDARRRCPGGNTSLHLFSKCQVLPTYGSGHVQPPLAHMLRRLPALAATVCTTLLGYSRPSLADSRVSIRISAPHWVGAFPETRDMGVTLCEAAGEATAGTSRAAYTELPQESAPQSEENCSMLLKINT